MVPGCAIQLNRHDVRRCKDESCLETERCGSDRRVEGPARVRVEPGGDVRCDDGTGAWLVALMRDAIGSQGGPYRP